MPQSHYTSQQAADDADIARYQALGETCTLWGKRASTMQREELLVFVGVLDELITLVRSGVGPTPYKGETPCQTK